MTFNDLMQDLADDLNTAEIAKKHDVSLRHVQRKIREAKKRCLMTTVWGVVAVHFRKNLIK